MNIKTASIINVHNETFLHPSRTRRKDSLNSGRLKDTRLRIACTIAGSSRENYMSEWARERREMEGHGTKKKQNPKIDAGSVCRKRGATNYMDRRRGEDIHRKGEAFSFQFHGLYSFPSIQWQEKELHIRNRPEFNPLLLAIQAFPSTHCAF